MSVGYKWVYPMKSKSDGTFDHHKGRFLAKGLNQQVGIDYEDKFRHTVVTTRSGLQYPSPETGPFDRSMSRMPLVMKHL